MPTEFPPISTLRLVAGAQAEDGGGGGDEEEFGGGGRPYPGDPGGLQVRDGEAAEGMGQRIERARARTEREDDERQ